MPSDHSFAPTSWTKIAQAGDRKSPDHEEAMRFLCNRYWYPLYAYCRRKFSKSPQEAEDLTQSFFSRLIERGIVGEAKSERGKFRTFLLTCFKRFIINEFERAGIHCISIDQEDAEHRMALEPADRGLSPEESFNRDWALQVLKHSQTALQTSYEQRGRETWYDTLKPYLQGKPTSGEYVHAASSLGTSVDAVKAEVSRMRKRYQENIRQHIADTLDEGTSIDEELRDLFAVLSK